VHVHYKDHLKITLAKIIMINDEFLKKLEMVKMLSINKSTNYYWTPSFFLCIFLKKYESTNYHEKKKKYT
jgi:hypothetical protein